MEPSRRVLPFALPACGFTGPKHATVAARRHAPHHPPGHPRHHSSATRGARCRSALLPAACQRVAARVVGVRRLRVSCDSRAHDDTCGVYRLGEVLSVESVLIEYTLHRANLTGRAGWYRRAGGEAVRRGRSRRTPLCLDARRDIVWSGEQERPLTLCVSGSSRKNVEHFSTPPGGGNSCSLFGKNSATSFQIRK